MSSARSRRKVHSQNFLHNPRLIRRLVASSSLDSDDLVIEIGPGEGALTVELLRHCRQVLAIERDEHLIDRLQKRLQGQHGFTLFAGDFLDFPLPHTPYKVFANLPFRHTAAMVGKLTTGSAPPADMYLVMQAEAAQRFTGQPQGTMVSAQLAPWFDREIVYRFRRSDFRPTPAVDSVLLRISKRLDYPIPIAERERYLDLVAAVYSAWKPTVRSALACLLPRRIVGAVERILATDLSVRPSGCPDETWIALYGALTRMAGNGIWVSLSEDHQRLVEQQSNLERRTQTPPSYRADGKRRRKARNRQ